MLQVTLEENSVLEALIACEPEPLAALEEASLPARSHPCSTHPCSPHASSSHPCSPAVGPWLTLPLQPSEDGVHPVGRV